MATADVVIGFLAGMIVGIIVGVTRTVTTMEKNPDRWLKAGVRANVKRMDK